MLTKQPPYPSWPFLDYSYSISFAEIHLIYLALKYIAFNVTCFAVQNSLIIQCIGIIVLFTLYINIVNFLLFTNNILWEKKIILIILVFLFKSLFTLSHFNLKKIASICMTLKWLQQKRKKHCTVRKLHNTLLCRASIFPRSSVQVHGQCVSRQNHDDITPVHVYRGPRFQHSALKIRHSVPDLQSACAGDVNSCIHCKYLLN